MTDNGINLRELLAAKLSGPDASDKPSNPTENNLNIEDGLRDQVSALTAELTQIRQKGLEQQAEYGRALAAFFLEFFPNLYGPEEMLKDAKIWAETGDGTSGATAIVSGALEQVTECWLVNLTEDRARLARWLPKELKLRYSQLAEIEKHPQALARLSHHEVSYWHKAKPHLDALRMLHNKVVLAGEAAQQAIQMAKAAVQTGGLPLMTALAFETALKALETFDSLHSSIRDDLIYEVERCVVSAQGYLEHKLAASKDASSGRPLTGSDDTSTSRFEGHHMPDSAPPSSSSVEDYDWEPVNNYPLVNPATGLPTIGHDSVIDVGGNVFGTNNDWY